MINDFENDYELNQALVEFEGWRETNPSGSLESFIDCNHVLPVVAAELRKFTELEGEMKSLVSSQSSMSNTSMSESCRTIGSYRLVRLLGAGGMGEVWLANQLEPVKRQVAIKLIRHGYNSEIVAKRFKAEQDSLARMSHRNIARILDAGTTESDQPYFVMEFVSENSIVEYCNENQLSLEQRLEMFLQLCDGIQHAHQKSVLHRDIKPTNVLVADNLGCPEVKVIDFGLAKLISASKPNPRLTQAAVALGSPLWMSPEQARGRKPSEPDPVDTRTDIYSLGVLLYQLLTNSTPISEEFYHSASIQQMLLAIDEKVPAYPSVRLAEEKTSKAWIEQKTTSSFADWSSMLRDDLDWITMKAIEKEPDRRYPTVSAMANDIRRFISGDTVLARPASKVYLIKKFVRKNRVATIASAVAVLALLSAVIASTYFASIAESARRIADHERADLEKIAHAVAESIEGINAGKKKGEYDLVGSDFVSSLSQKLGSNEFSNSEVEVALRKELANALAVDGSTDLAKDELRKIVELSQGSADKVFYAKLELAVDHVIHNRLTEATALTRQCYLLLERFDDVKEYDLNRLSVDVVYAQILHNQDRNEEAVSLIEARLEILSEQDRHENWHVAHGMSVLASAYAVLGESANCEKSAGRAYRYAISSLGAENERTIKYELDHIVACAKNHKFEKSPDDIRNLMERIEEKFGNTTLRLHYVGQCLKYLEQRGCRDLKSLWQIHLSDCKSHFGHDFRTLAALEGLAFCHSIEEDWENALSLYRESAPYYEKTYGDESYRKGKWLLNQGVALWRLERLAEAKTAARKAGEILDDVPISKLPTDSPIRDSLARLWKVLDLPGSSSGKEPQHRHAGNVE